MLRLPLIGLTACIQPFGHRLFTSHAFSVAVQPARRALRMSLRGTSTPYSLSTPPFHRARLLLRLTDPAQAVCGIRDRAFCTSTTIFESSRHVAMPEFNMRHPDASASKNA